MLLDPFDWTADGWPRALGGDLGKPLRKPGGTVLQPDGPAISGPFRPDQIGPKFAFYLPRPGYLDRLTFASGALTLRGQGSGPADSSPLTFIAPDRAYQIDIDIEVTGKANGGLLMFYSRKLFCGLTFDAKDMHIYVNGIEAVWVPAGASVSQRLKQRLIYQDQVANFHSRSDGKAWKLIRSLAVSGYNHNIGDGFLSLRPSLFASGEGSVTFRSLQYKAIQQ
jgi:xylan 1,4-beta-xylosidase